MNDNRSHVAIENKEKVLVFDKVITILRLAMHNKTVGIAMNIYTNVY